MRRMDNRCDGGAVVVCMRGCRPQGRRNATFVDSRPRSRDPRHFSDAETLITMMRTRRTRWVLASLAVVVLGLGLAGPVAARGRIAPVTGVVITGHGYGPGVGMSQWGAEERASAGETHEQILSFYYPGTEIGTAPSATMRVLLAEAPAAHGRLPCRVSTRPGERRIRSPRRRARDRDRGRPRGPTAYVPYQADAQGRPTHVGRQRVSRHV